MKLSVSSYSFQQAIRKGLISQFDTVAEAKKLGISAIEFTDLQPANEPATLENQLKMAKELKKEAEKQGVTMVGSRIGADLAKSGEAADAEVERLCRQVDVAKAMGAKVMRHDVCYSLGAGKRSFDSVLPLLVENIRRVTDYAAANGIVTCTENHGYIAQDSARVERLCNAVAKENYGLLVDVGNFACVDEDSSVAVSRVANFAVHVHAKDFVKHPFAEHFAGGFETRGCNRLEGCAIGEGNIPVEQCLAILRRAGYNGYVSIEFEGSEDCFVGIAKGRDKLLSYGVEA